MFHCELLPIYLVNNLLGLGMDVGQEGLAHNLHSSPPKSVQWSQGSLWTRSSHVSMDLICALGHSDAGIEKAFSKLILQSWKHIIVQNILICRSIKISLHRKLEAYPNP